jgi:hypothetical protein
MRATREHGTLAPLSDYHTRLLLRGAHAEVYEIYKVEEGIRSPFGRWAGCVYGQSRIIGLGETPSGSGSGGGGVTPTAVAGNDVAGTGYGYSSVLSYESNEVWVLNLLTGESAQRWDVHEGLGIPSLVLKADGSVAWVADSYVNTATGFHQEWVYKMDRSGLKLLAHGTDIESDSLALAADGTAVFWIENGEPFSAPLE